MRFEQVGGPRIPAEDASIDVAISMLSFRYLDWDPLMAELHRVLRPGGVLAATVPSWMPEKLCWQLSAEYHAPLAAGGHVTSWGGNPTPARLAIFDANS